jgi:ankyrin repeat protein
VNEPSSGRKAPGTTPLHLAATGGHIAVMDELLERGANMEARTKGGCGCKLFQHMNVKLLLMGRKVGLSLLCSLNE